jgi:hypothetical protein
MIPRAIEMIFAVSSGLKDRGWKYQMEGSFLEVYNEVVSDAWGSRCRWMDMRLTWSRLTTCWEADSLIRKNTRSRLTKRAR